MNVVSLSTGTVRSGVAGYTVVVSQILQRNLLDTNEIVNGCVSGTRFETGLRFVIVILFTESNPRGISSGTLYVK